jgi:hypothetical protein
MRVAMAVSGMRNNFVFVVQSFKRTQGNEFQKMHVEFYVNILARACSAQESEEIVNFLNKFSCTLTRSISLELKFPLCWEHFSNINN